MKTEQANPWAVECGLSGAGVLRVIGRVKQPIVLCREELRAMETEEANDLLIICGSGTPKGSIGSCRGVLLEDVIKKAEVIREEENDTKKMFIIASADDGYKVVFSWQEIFNTTVGGGVMILIERDGMPLGGKNSCLELISVEDFYSGARYVKGLKTIEVVLVA